MAILINRETRVLTQGITGKESMFHTKLMLSYGTQIVAGVTHGKSGENVLGVPVYDTVSEALENHGIDASGIFVPARFAKDAAFEAIDAGIRLLVILTEGIPIHDVMRIKTFAKKKGTRVIGPNTPGIVTVEQCKIGFLDTHHVMSGNIGVISRSGTLTCLLYTSDAADE